MTSTITSLPALRELFAPVNPRSALKELPQLDVHAKRFLRLSPFVVRTRRHAVEKPGL
jgi:uncharacterized protein